MGITTVPPAALTPKTTILGAPKPPAVKQGPAEPICYEDLLMYFVSFRTKDFYARLISNLPSRNDPRVPMMGITVEKGFHVVLRNDEWIEKTSTTPEGIAEIRATIAHEGMHFVLNHVIRGIRLARGYKDKESRARFFQASNPAADMAVNNNLMAEMAEDGRTPSYTDIHTNKGHWVLPEVKKYPKDLSYDWYLSLLLGEDPPDDDAKKNMKGVKFVAMGAGDSGLAGKHVGAHHLWEELIDGLTEDEADALVSQLEADAFEKIKSAVDEQKKTRGTVPGFVEEALSQMLKPPEVPWKLLLRRFVHRCRLSNPLRSLQRPRKRWFGLGGALYPGMKRDKTFHLFFAIDTSGSMSSEDIEDGLSELGGILKTDKDIRVSVCEFDTMIHKEYELSSTGHPDPNVKGRGGTDFDAAFYRAQELAKNGKIDAIIIFTDGYAPQPNGQSHPPRDIPVMWCLTEGGEHPCPGFGYEVRRPRRKES